MSQIGKENIGTASEDNAVHFRIMKICQIKNPIVFSHSFPNIFSGKENIGTASEGTGPDGSERPAEPPAIVIYIVDPFTFGPASDSLENMRLTTLGLIRCFSQMLPNISETLKNNISLQLVSLDSILEIGQSQNHARMPSLMRGLAFSVFSQARR